MGAEVFFTKENNKDVEEAFRSAVKKAQWDYGHAGYTGTIAEKGTYLVVEDTPHAVEEAWKKAYAIIDSDDPRITKWGAAGAIRVVDKGFDGWAFFGWSPS